MGGFVLAGAFQIWNWDKRIAFYFSTIYKGKAYDKGFVYSLYTTFVLTITTSTSLVYLIVLAYLASTGFTRKSRFAEVTMLKLGQAQQLEQHSYS